MCQGSINKTNLKKEGRKKTALPFKVIKVCKLGDTRTNNSKLRHTSVDPHKESIAYPSLMGSLHEFSEVFHLPLRVWVLEQHSTDIFPTEVHFME